MQCSILSGNNILNATNSSTNFESTLTFAHKNKPSFWLLHAVGWFSYLVIFSFENLVFTTKNSNDILLIVPVFFSAVIAAVLTIPLRYCFQKCWQLKPLGLILTIILASLLVAALWTPLKNFVMWYAVQGMYPEGTQDPMRAAPTFWGMLDGLSYSFFMVFAWASLYFGINYHYRLMAEKQLHIEAVRLSHQAQIKMLRYQINPHFLFNTLNAISTLVVTGNKEKANGMIMRLSTFLRFSLDNDPEKKVALYEEIKASMLYLEIEKMRFEDRLSIELSIDPNTEVLLVPSLILQPLIENSIKYAIAKMHSEGIISIKAHCQHGKLFLSVSDNGPFALAKQASEEQAHSGVGIKNIRDRLAVLYADQFTFDYGPTETQGFQVDITIPMEQA